MKRKLEFDYIRTFTVLLVVIYHIFYIFNAQGVLGGIKSFSEVQYQDSILIFIYPWFMALLFIVSGVSSRYALEKMSKKDFMKKRTIKLLIPSTLGLFIFQWLPGLLNMKLGGAFEAFPKDMPKVIIYFIAALSGTGPLWYIQTLFLFTAVLLLIKKLDKNDKFYHLFGKIRAPFLLLLIPLFYLSSQVLNVPVIEVYRFGIYFMAFISGYFIFSHETVMEDLKKYTFILLPLALISGIIYTYYYFGKNYASPNTLKSIWTAIYMTLMILFILSSAKRWCTKESKVLNYFSKRSFGIYVFHLPVMTSLGVLLTEVLNLKGFPAYFILLLVSVPLSILLYELISKIPFLRFSILGIKKRGKTK